MAMTAAQKCKVYRDRKKAVSLSRQECDTEIQECDTEPVTVSEIVSQPDPVSLFEQECDTEMVDVTEIVTDMIAEIVTVSVTVSQPDPVSVTVSQPDPVSRYHSPTRYHGSAI